MPQSNSRFGLDIEEIERHMRQARPAPPTQASSDPSTDPLADLARIVGQDDPFRSVLAKRAAERPNDPRDAHESADAGGDEAFERMLSQEAQRREPHGRDDRDEGAHHASAYEADDPGYAAAVADLRQTERSRSRKGLVTVAVVLGVGVVAVGGALMLRGGSTLTADGEPPIVQAEREPLKVRPENPGGVDIPDQNKQIYERGAQEGQTAVVNREEQPLDVAEAARALPPTPPPAAPSASPSLGMSSSAMAALGEPRRVRTVTVRPDGSFVVPGEAASTPARTAAPAIDAPATPQGATTPQPTGPTRSIAAPAPAARAPAPEPQPSPSPALADPGPQRTASIPTQPPAARPAPEVTGATGAFSVQLAVGATEPEARTLATRLRQRFAGDLGSRAPAIRRAELNGKTLYRVRVESLSRDEANALCTKLRAAGGQCFIAKN